MRYNSYPGPKHQPSRFQGGYNFKSKHRPCKAALVFKKNVWCTIIFIYVTSTWRPITSHSPPAVSSYSHFWSIITWCHPLCHYCFTITWLNHLAKTNAWHVETYILKGIFLYHFFFFTKVYFRSYTKKKSYVVVFLQLKILLNIKIVFDHRATQRQTTMHACRPKDSFDSQLLATQLKWKMLSPKRYGKYGKLLLFNEFTLSFTVCRKKHLECC